MAFKITALTAYVVIDPDSGDEGILGYQISPGVWMPLIGADTDRILSMRDIATQICAATGTGYRILQFSDKTDVTEFYRK